MTKKHNLLSLFSGAGGFDKGFTMTRKYKHIFANDILSSAAKTFSCNHPHRTVTRLKGENLPLYLVEDIGKLRFEDIEFPEIDLLIGGPPCQDFSLVRGPNEERRGIKVQRGKLYSHFVRALIHLKPKVFVFENVPGLLSANKGVAYTSIKEDFSNLSIRWKHIKKIVGNGYEANNLNYNIIFSNPLNFAQFGVPQDRRRIIIIGVRSDLTSDNSEKLVECKKIASRKLDGNTSIFSRFPLTTLETFEGKVLTDLDEEYNSIMKKYSGLERTVKTPRAKWWANEWQKTTFDIFKDYKLTNQIKSDDYDAELDVAMKKHRTILKQLGYLGRNIEETEFPDETNERPKEAVSVRDRMEHIPPNENHIFVKGTKWDVEGKGISMIYRRIHPLKPSYTIVAKGGGGTGGYHYKIERGQLTNRERARIQTFPDSYKFKGGKLEVRSQIGEAVPPLLGKRIAEVGAKILNILGE